jgi:hypothetical protein
VISLTTAKLVTILEAVAAAAAAASKQVVELVSLHWSAKLAVSLWQVRALPTTEISGARQSLPLMQALRHRPALLVPSLPAYDERAALGSVYQQSTEETLSLLLVVASTWLLQYWSRDAYRCVYS